MKRFILYLLLLLVIIAMIALLVDRANLWLIRSSTGNSAYKMERLYANPNPDEIAIIGSSRACGNFVPSVISPRCFDYGENGMAMREIMSVLEVVQKRRTDAPIILNFDPWGGFGPCSFVADYCLVPQSGRVKFKNRIPGIRFFGSLRRNLVSAIDDRRSISKVIDRGAQLLTASRTVAEWKVIDASLETVNFCRDEEDERRLIGLLLACAPRKVYVVVCPCASGWMAKFSGNRDLQAFLSRMKELPNVVLIDYFASPLFTDADFTDPTHFNINGARKFSRILSKDLRGGGGR